MSLKDILPQWDQQTQNHPRDAHSLQRNPYTQLSPAQQDKHDLIFGPCCFPCFQLLANPRPHPRIYDVCTHIIAKKYFLPKGGGTKLNKQISRVRRCKPWLQNKAVPSEQLELVMRLDPHGSRFFLLVLRVATRRRRGGLSVAFSEEDLGRSWALLPSSGIERPREVVRPSHGSCHSPCSVS